MENKQLKSQNQRELKKKLKKKLQGESLAKDLLWKQLQLFKFQNPFSVSTSLCFILLLPELAPAETVAKLFRSVFFSAIQIKERKLLQGAGGYKKKFGDTEIQKYTMKDVWRLPRTF